MKAILVAAVCAASVFLTGATSQPATWWVQGAPVSGNPVGCAFSNNAAVPLRIDTYRFHVPGRTPYVFPCNTNCVVYPGQTRTMVSPITNASGFVFTCDALVANF